MILLQHLHFFYVVIRAATKLLYSGSCIFFRESSTTWYYSFNEIFSHLQFDTDDEVLYSASYIYEAHRLPIGKHLSKQSYLIGYYNRSVMLAASFFRRHLRI